MDKVLAVLAILATVHVGVQGQVVANSPAGWERASQAPAKTFVRVTLHDGTVVSGLLLVLQNDQLVISDHTLERGKLTGDLTKPYALPRAQIAKVEIRQQPQKKSAKRTVLMAIATAGAVIGVIALVIVARCASEQGRCGA